MQRNRELLKKNAAEIARANNEQLRTISLILVVLFALVMIFEISFTGWTCDSFSLILLMIISLGFYFFSKTFLEKPSSFSIWFVYLFFTVLIAFAIYFHLGSPQLTTFMYTCTVLLFPAFIVDYAFRVNLFLFVVTLAFAVLAFVFESWETMLSDIVNAGSAFVLSVIVGRDFRKTKLNAIERARELFVERNTDPLTGLPNRRDLFERLASLDNKGISVLSVLMVDIDFYKKFNDSYGHQRGDECLRMLGKCFSNFSERTGIKFFRYGGEEFLALAECYAYSSMREIAEDLLQEVKSLDIHFDYSSTKRVTVSAGYAEAKECSAKNCENLIGMADSALYYAKAHGRNQSVGFLECDENFTLKAMDATTSFRRRK